MALERLTSQRGGGCLDSNPHVCRRRSGTTPRPPSLYIRSQVLPQTLRPRWDPTTVHLFPWVVTVTEEVRGWGSRYGVACLVGREWRDWDGRHRVLASERVTRYGNGEAIGWVGYSESQEGADGRPPLLQGLTYLPFFLRTGVPVTQDNRKSPTLPSNRPTRHRFLTLRSQGHRNRAHKDPHSPEESVPLGVGDPFVIRESRLKVRVGGRRG